MLQLNDRFHSITLDHKRSLQRLSEKPSNHLEDVLEAFSVNSNVCFFLNFLDISDFAQVFENKDA